VADPIQVIKNILPAVRQVCDILIILSHLGHSIHAQSALVSGAGDIELAESLPPRSVDLIVGGHTHQAFNEQGLGSQNIIKGAPIVQAGSQGRFLGEVTLTVCHSVTVTDAHLTPILDLPVDEAFEGRFVRPILTRLRPKLKQKMGALINHRDLSRDAVHNEFASGESALANFINDAIVSCCRFHLLPVDIAIIDASVIHNGLPMVAHLTREDFYRLMSFPDTIRVSWISGHVLHDLLMDNAQRLNFSGEPHTERGFLHFSLEVRYHIQLGLNRYENYADHFLVHDRPLESQLDRKFLVAFPSFLREMAAAWEKQLGEKMTYLRVNTRSWVYEDTGIFLRWEIQAFIREHGGIIERSGARGRLKVDSHFFAPVRQAVMAA
jgi:5'-nucleotidase/UDP-sugar diphosphatase